MTQGVSLDSELNGQALKPIRRTQSKRSFQRIPDLRWLQRDLDWTHFLRKQEEQGLGTSHSVRAGSPVRMISWDQPADYLKTKHSFPEDCMPQSLYEPINKADTWKKLLLLQSFLCFNFSFPGEIFQGYSTESFPWELRPGLAVLFWLPWLVQPVHRPITGSKPLCFSPLPN